MRHSGQAYHEFMLRSRRDQRARERFQQLVFQVLRPHGTIVDFGAGTGLDAKRYAIQGFKVLAHEPSQANLDHLRKYCREEIGNGEITISDLSGTVASDMIVANFAVLNLIDDHRNLFERFAGIVASGNFVLVSVLNPLFLGDIRYPWWWRHLFALIRRGAYAVEGEFGPVYRFTPSALSRAARPYFRLARIVPGRWVLTLGSQYVFLLFQKN